MFGNRKKERTEALGWPQNVFLFPPPALFRSGRNSAALVVKLKFSVVFFCFFSLSRRSNNVGAVFHAMFFANGDVFCEECRWRWWWWFDCLMWHKMKSSVTQPSVIDREQSALGLKSVSTSSLEPLQLRRLVSVSARHTSICGGFRTNKIDWSKDCESSQSLKCWNIISSSLFAQTWHWGPPPPSFFDPTWWNPFATLHESKTHKRIPAAHTCKY